MKASELGFLSFLQRDVQFVIPIYQRIYSWTTKQCEQMWDDILRTGSDEEVEGHFVGSIVYIEKGLQLIGPVPQFLVIDGQQRLTTITLLLTALRASLEQVQRSAAFSPRKIENLYLFNPEEEGELRYKLRLTRSDRDTLRCMVDGRPHDAQPSRRLLENYQFFERRLQNPEVDPNDVLRGIQKLIIVGISLDRRYDNPQLIFESLNSTGLELSQADLIRNYILMDLEPAEQDALYSDYWYPMERSFGELGYAKHFDRFMRDYLTVKTGRIPNESAIYDAFKIYRRQFSGSLKHLVEEIRRYANHFVNLALEKELSPAIREAIHDLNTLKVNVAYPFLLEAYDDYEHSLLSRDELVSILRLVESYVIRRAICGIPTNSLNKTFLTLGSIVDKDRYVESVKAVFQLLDSYRRFPTDAEFAQDFVTRDIYNLTNRRNYILSKLENYNRKEVVNIEALTIEHIMPQNPNLSASWRQALGADWEAVQAKYLHSIGNLTLTGYNSELGDRSFHEKQTVEGGFQDSPLHLNQDLRHLDSWNEFAIRQRGAKLAKLATLIWPAPGLPPDILRQFERDSDPKTKPIYTLADHQYLVGPMLQLFEQLQHRVLNLDPAVYEDILKLYIAYKADTNFLDVVPQRKRLRLSLNMDFDEIEDPKGWCKDVTDIGRWGNGNVEFGIADVSELEYSMFLIRQAYQKQVGSLDE